MPVALNGNGPVCMEPLPFVSSIASLVTFAVFELRFSVDFTFPLLSLQVKESVKLEPMLMSALLVPPNEPALKLPLLPPPPLPPLPFPLPLPPPPPPPGDATAGGVARNATFQESA